MTMMTMQALNLKNKRVLIREDFNVPMKNGKITSDARLRAALPSIQMAQKAGASIMLCSHLGRPTEGQYDQNFSLEPVAIELSQLLQQRVVFIRDWLCGLKIPLGKIVLCENVRFNVGEKTNQEALAKQMASLCDVYVMDAFATAHRAQASTCGVAKFAPIACAGPLLIKEVAAVNKALIDPKHPVVAVVGGAKVSTKLKVLNSLVKKVDGLIVGGGIANTFIAAKGYTVGNSLYEQDFLDEAKRLMEMASNSHKNILIPEDVVVAKNLSKPSDTYVKAINGISKHEKILDIGLQTSKYFSHIIKKAKTVLWSGPVGAFEIEPFSKGTKAIAKAIAQSQAFSIAGGGDTLAAIEKYGVADKLSYISTGGGAFLSCLEGKKLPAIDILEQRFQQASKK